MSTARIAFVRSVIAASTAAGSRFSVTRVDVGEDRRRTLVENAVRRGDERERRGDRLVARPETGEADAEVQPRRAARDRGHEGRADPLGEGVLEALDHGPEREPPGAEHLEDELLLSRANPRARERDRLARGRQLPGTGEGLGTCSSHSE